MCSFKILSSQDTAWFYNSEKAFGYFIVVTQVGLQAALRGLGHTHTLSQSLSCRSPRLWLSLSCTEWKRDVDLW